MRLTPSTFARALGAASLLLAFAVVPALARGTGVEIWTDRGDDAIYEPGDPMRVKVRTSEDAYLLVYEIDSEGAVNLLYPWKRGAGRIEARRTLRLPEDQSDYNLVVERSTGQGFIVAVASDHPFIELPWFLRPFDPQAAAVGYEGDPGERDKDEEGFDDKGHVVGDPYVAMERIRRRVMDRPGDTQGFSSAYTTYYVHEQVRYPRYLCNDCHRPNQWAWWNGFDPYYTHCSVVDFRVNWSWCWGPQMWTSYLPYYYYVVRSDCPPRYQHYYTDRTRFSSWDGWNRFNELSGGHLRRFKPPLQPVGYTPPPPRGTIWRQGQTPPGFVPPDVRRQTGTPGSGPQGWLQRDRGDGKPVWREGPRTRPDNGGNSGGSLPGVTRGGTPWREKWGGGNNPPPQGGQGGQVKPDDHGGSGGSGESGERGRPMWKPTDSPRNDPPRQDPPRQDPPKQDPPRDNPPPMWKQPPPDNPKWAPAPSKPEPGKGRGGKGKG